MSPYTKLAVGAAVMACATTYLAYLGASASWQYYLHVDECVQGRDKFLGARLRVSGRVATNSLNLRADRSLATFVLCGHQSRIQVSCKGPLPDNLAEEMDVVVEGTLEKDGQLRGEKVMTRCASKYQADEQST